MFIHLCFIEKQGLIFLKPKAAKSLLTFALNVI